MITEDRNDPGLKKVGPDGQQEAYLVLSVEEREKGFVRPLRHSYKHSKCGAVTKMGGALAETYARDPKFYGATYCVRCQGHFPVAEFHWLDEGMVTDQSLGD